jgi:hypothetical protein
MSEKRGRLERATKSVGSEECLTTLKIEGESVTLRTSASPVELAMAVKRIAARRRAETKMRQRGL